MTLSSLQQKLNAYLDFIQSGQLVESYTDAQNKKMVISVAVKYAPNADAFALLGQCKNMIEQQGIRFEWKPFQ